MWRLVVQVHNMTYEDYTDRFGNEGITEVDFQVYTLNNTHTHKQMYKQTNKQFRRVTCLSGLN